MHVHFGLKLPGAAGAALADENDMQLVMRMADNARKSLYAGITTVRLTGENHGSDFALKGAIDGGTALGPRIHTAGEIIAATGGHGDLEADGAAEFAKVVREQIKRGATWIKVAISGGISDSHGSIAASSLLPEEMRTIIEVAHRNGVKVTAHNGSPIAADEAISLGIDCFEHAYHLTDKQLKAMKAPVPGWYPRPWSPTRARWSSARRSARRRGTSTECAARASTITRCCRQRSSWASISRSAPISFRSSPTPARRSTVHEAELYVAAGMTPLDQIAPRPSIPPHARSRQGRGLARCRVNTPTSSPSTAILLRTSRAADDQLRDEGWPGDQRTEGDEVRYMSVEGSAGVVALRGGAAADQR